MQELPLFLVSSTFPNKGGSLRSCVSYCFQAFFQHHIVGFWREYLLKVFQNFEKIEADATLSTLVEFSIFWTDDSLCQSWSVKFAVTRSLSLLWSVALSFAVSHSFCHSLHHFLLVFFCSHTHRFTPSQAINYFNF